MGSQNDRQFYQQHFLNPDEAGLRVGVDEEIRTTPLFSYAVQEGMKARERSIRVTGSSSSAVSRDHDDSTADEGSDDDDTTTDEDPGNEETSTRKDSAIFIANQKSKHDNTVGSILPQYGLLGFHIGQHRCIAKNEPIFMNTNAPSSTFICGLQGSGKSYTLSSMLENCLLADSWIGNLNSPVAGVVFHYNTDASGSTASSAIAEAAHLCSRESAYSKIVNSSKDKLTVVPLLLRQEDINIDRMHKLMAFNEKDGSTVPLYMEVVQRILREMAISAKGGPFSYAAFKSNLQNAGLTRDQDGPLKLRLSLLEAFLELPDSRQKANKVDHPLALKPGTLTIIDLSDPFINPASACMLFEICLALIKERRPAAGLVIALDEAHRYLSATSSAANFTERLIATIREQRHNATRVIIATQEPTISPRLLDLCSVTICHRFTSPAWFREIAAHLGGVSDLALMDTDVDNDMDASADENAAPASKPLPPSRRAAALFDRIANLNVGESLVFAPSAFLCLDPDARDTPKKLGLQPVKMKTRWRQGDDGGTSVLATGSMKVVLR